MSHHITVINQIKEIYWSLADIAWLKASFSGFLTYLLAAIGQENVLFVQYLAVLVVVDLITGVCAAATAGERVESRKIFKTATKSVVYLLFIIAAHATTEVVPVSGFIMTGVVAFLALTEFFSVVENIAKMGYKTPQRFLNQEPKKFLRDQIKPKKGIIKKKK